MRKRLFYLTSLWSMLLLACGHALAQTSAQQQPLVAQLPQGGVVVFRIRTTPVNTGALAEESEQGVRLPLNPQLMLGDGGVLHRWLTDEKGNLMFGYDLKVERLSDSNRFRVTALPLDSRFGARFASTQTPPATSTLVRATEAQLISDGETFALDLLINEQMGLKVVDFIKVSTEATQLPAPSYSLPARDFALTNVELAIRNYQLSIDGETLRTASARRSCTGSLVWFALPEGGRFIFSLVPHEGYDFRKLGVIENNKIAFTWKEKRYEWTSEAPIVGSGGVWNLWVLHDPAYVDPFAPPVNAAAQESRLARMLRDPLSTLSEPAGDARRNGLQTKERRATVAPKRVRVHIGGANSIEALLPKD